MTQLPLNSGLPRVVRAVNELPTQPGPGLRQSGATIYAPPSENLLPAATLCYIASTSGTGDGWYLGFVVGPPDHPVDPTVGLDKSSLGNTSSGSLIYLANPAEVGQPGHQLEANTDTSFCFAYPYTIAPDSRVCYRIAAGSSSELNVLLTQDGTDSSGYPLYTMKRLNGTVIATKVPLKIQRPIAGDIPTSPATRGRAVYIAGSTGNGFPTAPSGSGSGGSSAGSSSGAVVQPYELWEADEVFGTEDACNTGGSSSSSGGSGT